MLQRSPSHVAVWVFVAAFGALFIFWGGLNAARFVFDQQSTSGVVAETQPLNHNQVVVRYEAGGRELRLTRPWGGTGLPQVGQAVTVYYLSAEPETASLDTPATAFTNGVLGTFVAAGFAAFGAYVLLLRYGRLSRT